RPSQIDGSPCMCAGFINIINEFAVGPRCIARTPSRGNRQERLIMRTSSFARFVSTASLVAMLLFLEHGPSQDRQTPPPPVYKPEITYTSPKGTTQSTYVANSDGTNAVAVYSVKSGGAG